MTDVLELPVLDESRCTGCGLCPAVCPTDCLEMAGPLPWLPRPRDCVSCALCVLICPVEALRLAEETLGHDPAGSETRAEHGS